MNAPKLSPLRRRAMIDALRRGTVPDAALGFLAVGLDRFVGAVDDEFATVRGGGAAFKAIRGEYGTGKTFFVRWLQERARELGFASAEVQISETETPLHRVETVYRRAMERLATEDTAMAALSAVVERWFFALEEDVAAQGLADTDDAFEPAVVVLMEKRLAAISREAPQFAAALRAIRHARHTGDAETSQGLLAWLSGQPNVGAAVKRTAGVKGDLDHFGALSFLRGVLTLLREAGHPGLVLVLDEVETLQRVRSDVREKSLNALRGLLDDLDAGRFPGLYLLITGTTAFFDGPHGVQRLAPLAQRLHVDFETAQRFDNPRAVQIRLATFDAARLCAVGRKVRDLYVADVPGEAGARVAALCDDAWIESFVGAVTGRLGLDVGLAPRLFLKKLIGDVLDRVREFDDFDPRRDYKPMLNLRELTDAERQALRPTSVDEIPLD